MNVPTSTSTPRITGTVTWYNKVSGFGFIRVEGMSDIFVREAAIDVPGRRVLREGETVALEIIERDGRREASKVVPIHEVRTGPRTPAGRRVVDQ